ncbi:MAG TPA: YlqD family protein [Pseudogracilibacillus sp.]|nr:YlqD family protein [Pseudogracilibacillus sp.]
MKVIKQILIKQVITENSKIKLEKKFKQEKSDLDLECKQLIFEKKKLQKERKSATHKIEQRFQIEIDNRKRKINQIDFKLGQLYQLPLGSEILESKMDSLIEVTTGMNWEKFQNETAIIIKDDIVLRIDNE